MAARTPVLDKTDLFGTLPPELLEQLRGRTALGRYRRGDAIFEKGDPAHPACTSCFSGRVAIVAKATDGRESVLTVLGPGALFGEMSMFDGGVRSANARALTTVHLIAVDFDDVRDVLAHRPEVLWAVVRILARRLAGDRRGARRRDVPRRDRPHRQAAARAGRRRGRLPHAAHPRGARRHGRRVA